MPTPQAQRRQPLQVPAEIGIAGQTAISSMHTHDPTGIIHIESPTNATFTQPPDHYDFPAGL